MIVDERNDFECNGLKTGHIIIVDEWIRDYTDFEYNELENDYLKYCIYYTL